MGIPRPTQRIHLTIVAYSQPLEDWFLGHPQAFFSRSMRQPDRSFGVLPVGGNTLAAPISFTLEGRQVIAVLAGQSLIVFGL